MKNRTQRFIASAAALLLLLLGCLSGCADKKPEANELGIQHELEFGGVYVLVTIDDFNALGFTYGDSLNVSFSNGYTLEGLPYYNGYYTQTGEPLVVAYPGYPYVKVCINNGDDLFEVAGLSESDRATITLKEKAAFFSIQNARDIHYKDDRSLFDSDEMFANFRAVSAGQIKANTLYRSASPCDNQHNRASYVDTLMGQAGVKLIIDLADNDEKIAGYMQKEDFNSPYFKTLYEQNSVVPLALNTNYGSEAFQKKLLKGLEAMAASSGPYLVHCTEGKDRTGFVCMLLEALCGATYQEIVDDYMITYQNYYRITKESDPDRYDVIVHEVLEPMIKLVVGKDVDLKTADYAALTAAYLTNAGMTAQQVEALRAGLTTK